MASGNTLCLFTPYSFEPAAASPATIDARNAHPILAYGDGNETPLRNIAFFSTILPRHYAGGGVTVAVTWAAVATSGTVGWLVAFEKIGVAVHDLDVDAFAADATITAATVPANSGDAAVTEVAMANGAPIDSISVGRHFRLRLKRDTAVDTAVGDAQFLGLEMRET